MPVPLPPPAGGVPAAPPDPAADARTSSAREVVSLALKAARAAGLYPRQSKVRQAMLVEFAERLAAHLAEHGETALGIRQTSITAWGVPVHEEEARASSAAFRLFAGGVRAVVLSPGLATREAEDLLDVLGVALRPDAAPEDVQTAAWERCLDHVSFVVESGAGASGAADVESYLRTATADAREAVPARAAEAPIFSRLEGCPPSGDEDDAAPARLGGDELGRLEALRAAEAARDLFGEVEGFLAETVEASGADSVRAPLEEFAEHLVTSGDLLRAARLLSRLRALAAEARDPAAAHVLADVVERIGRTRVVPSLGPLADSLADADREGFALLLAAVGEGAVAPLCRLLATPSRETALAALRVLASRHAGALAPFLLDPDPEIARPVLGLFAGHVPPEHLDELLPALRHDDPGLRRQALAAVASAGGPRATGLLLASLDDPVYEIRAHALDALGTLRDPLAVAPLLARVRDGSFARASIWEKRETFRALGRIGSAEAAAALTRMLETTRVFRRDEDDEIRCLAASALALVGGPGARSALARHENDRSEPVRRVVRTALRDVDRRAAPPRVPPPAPRGGGG